MLNRRMSSMDRTSNGNHINGTEALFSSSPKSTGGFSPQYLFNRSISTPSPSLPKAIPFTNHYREQRSRSVYSPNGGQLDTGATPPPCTSPITFNRYINVNQQPATPDQGSSPTSWYARLSSSLKKSVLRRSTSQRESASQKRILAQRRSVIISFAI